MGWHTKVVEWKREYHSIAEEKDEDSSYSCDPIFRALKYRKGKINLEQ